MSISLMFRCAFSGLVFAFHMYFYCCGVCLVIFGSGMCNRCHQRDFDIESVILAPALFVGTSFDLDEMFVVSSD